MLKDNKPIPSLSGDKDQVAVWGEDNALTGDSGFTYDSTNQIVNLEAARFNPLCDPPPESEGTVWWSDEDYTLNLASGEGPVLQVGQEQWAIVYNGTGATIPNGSVVRHEAGSGIINGKPYITYANASSYPEVLGQLGVATMDIPDGAFGIVTIYGKVRGIDTSMWPVGSPLWIGTTDGGMTNVKPSFPDYNILLGLVTVSDSTSGEVLVTIKDHPIATVNNFFNHLLVLLI